MSNNLHTKLYNFLSTVEEEAITTGSVIYQVMEEDPRISKNDLKNIIEYAVTYVNQQNTRGSSRYMTLLEILPEFDVSYKAVNSLRVIGAVKINDEEPLSSDQIRSNINKLKSKLKKITNTLYQCLFSAVSNIPISKLTWKDPLGSQVISDRSDVVKSLPKHLQDSFMKPVREMVPQSLPPIIENTCDEFVKKFVTHNKRLPQALLHDGNVERSNSWNNPAFGPEHAESLNEGTYVTNMIVPALQASLKNLPYGKTCYITTFERQSIASADRRGEGQSGRRPDIIFIMKDKNKKYELMYSECSRLFCSPQKIEDDVKLWRETNDGMYWVYKSRRPEKDQFRIIGLQVAGSLLRLSVLIRDGANVDRYYHLHESKIPVQYSDSAIVAKFIETLLITRNILIVNMSLLPHGSIPKLERQKEASSTVDSE
ncbi:4159_t:CDS:2 [Paraglomus occultum]|uniref:4159_t:CDS:1 n=1 Tax=Paraglomus occultum TaxID=144539 RepID=A0A9N9CZW3_9GLOM|nr:4159_t:CDS:2 [Paraglomus occultum]